MEFAARLDDAGHGSKAALGFLQIVSDFAVRADAENEAVTFRRRLQELRQSPDHFPQTGTGADRNQMPRMIFRPILRCRPRRFAFGHFFRDQFLLRQLADGGLGRDLLIPIDTVG